ncbi:uncharacterized protein LOC110417217 [Herrania umbratica]|uniref:Uncharacterized protein LOC110417217 n=1 Tax=Herrania umbratica TaxID=108875 RepID=A0A6J1AEQ3_9ROSI|nr:uncharacterized protein LOC110417217 [Herrania umbratica]
MGFSKEDGLLSKTISMVLSLCSIISGSFRFQSPMQIQKEGTAYKHLLLPGLKTLIYAPGTPPTQSPTHSNPLIIHSYTIPQAVHSFQSLFRSLSTHSSSYSSWSSGMDDMLGTESGVYMSPDELQMPEMERANGNRDYNPNKRKQGLAMKGEYPPAIPLLARTGNLPGHMPWILRRHYSNGRLILKEEKVKHHEYFEAYRENGRLILELVSLDDTFTSFQAVYDEKDEEVELENAEFFEGEELEKVKEYDDEEPEADGDDEDNGSVYVPRFNNDLISFSVPELYHGNERYGDPRKCLTYSGRFISELSSIFCSAGEQEGSSVPLVFCNTMAPITTSTTACDVACLVK